MMSRLVSVIIATTATAQRAAFLSRALLSLLNEQADTVVPIVVVNGPHCAPEVVQSLRRRPDIRCIYLDEGGLPGARIAGRNAVDTEFFGLLDDDDEYLPTAVETRLRPLIIDNSFDVVVTNGYRHQNDRDVIAFREFATFEVDPLGRLMDHSWLTSAGGLFRTQSVQLEYFDVPAYMEMTYMAMKLALNRKLIFLDIPTYRLHGNTPDSLSASEHYVRREPEGIRKMLALNPPARIKRCLRQKHTASLHDISDFERRRGNYLAAWRYHVKSLLSPYGIRHLPYTRHLMSLPSTCPNRG
jgi:glycosyltransferase involved in cell wall biosynthesis